MATDKDFAEAMEIDKAKLIIVEYDMASRGFVGLSLTDVKALPQSNGQAMPAKATEFDLPSFSAVVVQDNASRRAGNPSDSSRWLMDQ